MREWAQGFHENFLGELARAGYTPEQALKWVWKPYRAENLRIIGEGRDCNLDRLALERGQIADAMQRAAGEGPHIDRDFYRSQKIVLVLVPGFTHETLRNLSWHEQIERKD